MVSKVYQREQSLKERVQQLEVMIDESKRDKQVSEIVESDFFNDLTAKAVELRKRTKSGGKTN